MSVKWCAGKQIVVSSYDEIELSNQKEQFAENAAT